MEMGIYGVSIVLARSSGSEGLDKEAFLSIYPTSVFVRNTVQYHEILPVTPFECDCLQRQIMPRYHR